MAERPKGGLPTLGESPTQQWVLKQQTAPPNSGWGRLDHRPDSSYFRSRRTETQLVTAEPPTLKDTPTLGVFLESLAPMGSPTSCL